MSELSVVTDDIRVYGTTATEAAGHVARAALVDLNANIAAVAPALGPIGLEFLEAFARAQTTHTKDVAALSLFYAGTAAAATATADTYERTDQSTATKLRRTAANNGDLA